MTITAFDLDRLARSRGGNCVGLSSGEGVRAKYIWRCSKGHTWEARLDSVEHGSWCRRCNSDSQKNTIEQMQALALTLGGKCLSSVYVDTFTKLIWQCGQGHTWEASPHHVKRGRWCRICGNKRAIAERTTNMREIQALAAARKGKCLSDSYVPGRTLKWQCEHGHVWEAELHNVKSRSWCPVCGHLRGGRLRRRSIEEMRDIAHSRGGKCLSTSYQNTDSKMQWECSEGHIWLAIPSAVKKGHWCPECAGVKKHEIEDAQELARSRGGECISEEYHSVNRHLKWRCSEGHTWVAQYANVASGRWCPECSAGLGERICRAHFEQMFGYYFPKSRPDWLTNSDGYHMELDGYCEDLALAFEHQGRQHQTAGHFFYYSQGDYVKRRRDDRRKKALCQRHGVTLLEIPEILHTLPLARVQQYIVGQCRAQGVALPETATGVTVKLLKAYTPDARERMEAIVTTVSMHGGVCLSPAYLGSQTPLRFRCSQGHEWDTTPSVIVKGHWCPECSTSRRSHARRLGLPEMQSLADSREGRCLSTEYVNANIHLLWQCRKGHQWKAIPNSIKRGSWCPVCSKEKRRKGTTRRREVPDS